MTWPRQLEAGIKEVFEEFLSLIHSVLGLGQQHTIPTVHNLSMFGISHQLSIKNPAPVGFTGTAPIGDK